MVTSLLFWPEPQSCNNHTQDMVQRQCSCKKFSFNNYCFPQKEFSHKKKRKKQTKKDHNKAKPPNLLQTLFCSLMNMGVTEYMAVTLIALTVQLNPSLMPMFCWYLWKKIWSFTKAACFLAYKVYIEFSMRFLTITSKV